MDALAYGADIPPERLGIRETYLGKIRESEALTQKHLAKTKKVEKDAGKGEEDKTGPR